MFTIKVARVNPMNMDIVIRGLSSSLIFSWESSPFECGVSFELRVCAVVAGDRLVSLLSSRSPKPTKLHSYPAISAKRVRGLGQCRNLLTSSHKAPLGHYRIMYECWQHKTLSVHHGMSNATGGLSTRAYEHDSSAEAV